MSIKLWQIIDASGSMAENAKRLIVRETLRTISQYVNYNSYDIELHYILVGNDVKIIDASLERTYPDAFFELGTGFDVKGLVEKLATLDGCFLFLTDCSWGHSIVSTLRKWKDKLPPKMVKIIQVVPGILRLQRDFDSYLSEDAIAALDDWLDKTEPQTTEEDKDEW